MPLSSALIQHTLLMGTRWVEEGRTQETEGHLLDCLFEDDMVAEASCAYDGTRLQIAYTITGPVYAQSRVTLDAELIGGMATMRDQQQGAEQR